jgi:hypothetical protein
MGFPKPFLGAPEKFINPRLKELKYWPKWSGRNVLKVDRVLAIDD